MRLIEVIAQDTQDARYFLAKLPKRKDIIALGSQVDGYSFYVIHVLLKTNKAVEVFRKTFEHTAWDKTIALMEEATQKSGWEMLGLIEGKTIAVKYSRR